MEVTTVVKIVGCESIQEGLVALARGVLIAIVLLV